MPMSINTGYSPVYSVFHFHWCWRPPEPVDVFRGYTRSLVEITLIVKIEPTPAKDGPVANEYLPIVIDCIEIPLLQSKR